MTNRTGIPSKTYYEPIARPANTNNQLTTCPNGYDAAGNMTSNGSASYVYDTENRLIWTSGYRYLYDGDGERVEKCVAATPTTACPTSGTNGTLYWRGLGSDPLSETDLSGNVLNTYIFFNGQRVARSDSAGSVHYYFSDHLGTHGVVENATATVCEQDIDYYPYGGVQNDYCPNVAQNYKFTGKERDAESGLDNFGARYSTSSLGRFMTPDWSTKPQTVPYADLANPQTLNLYPYVVNNPLNRTDPLGHDWFYVGKKWQWQKGHLYHDANGNATKDKGYAGLLVAQATGTNKQGATTYNLTLYDQNKVVATGTGFSGSNNYANTGAIKDGNYQILGRFDSPPTAPNPASPDNNPPPVYGYQKIDPGINPYENAVYQAYGPMRARLNPLDPSGSQGAYFHGQFGDAFHSEGWTHGCLSYGRDTTMIDYMSSHFGNTWTGVSVDSQVERPQ